VTVRFDAFIGGSYQSEAITADCEETWNFYPEQLESPGATARVALYPTPGVVALDTVSVGSGRGHFYQNDREFAVIGAKFGEISSVGTWTERGDVALDSNPATICSNGDGGAQLFITSGGNGYCYDLTTDTLSQVVALNGKAVIGDHLDGYFLALDTATSTLYLSALLDGTSWTTGLDYAQRSIMPDRWLSMKVVGRYIWLFGGQTSEVWYNTGASFPFAPHPSGLLSYGIIAPFSIGVMGQEVIWLAASRTGYGQVVRAAGFTPEVVSNQALERQIQGYEGIEDSIGDLYADRGHDFFMLSFDKEAVTWCWDYKTRVWVKRGSWDAPSSAFTSWRPRYHAFAFGEHRMLDANLGAIYRMSSDLTTDVDGDTIRRLRRGPAIVNENARVFYAFFELDLETGLGNAVAPGDNPQVMLRMSNDGGKTWGTEQMRPAGKQGEYGTRVRWLRLGSGRRRVFEVTMTDPIPYRIVGAYLGIIQGANPQQQQQQQGRGE